MAEYVISLYHDTRRQKSGKIYPVKLRVYFDYKTKFYPVGIDLTEEDFNRAYKSERPRGEYRDLRKKLLNALSRAHGIADELKVFSFDLFEKRLLRPTGAGTDAFYHYQIVIDELKQQGRIGTTSNYLLSLKSLKAYLTSTGRSINRLLFDSITVSFLNGYEKWMIASGKSNTTVGIYLRPLRAIFNRAKDGGDIPPDCYPFGKRKYQIPQGRNVKKALSKEDLKLLFTKELPSNDPMAKARDFFFFSYAVNGINVKDIAGLKYRDLAGDTLTFIRAKTKNTTRGNQRPVIASLNVFAKGIIQKYGNRKIDGDTYIFPVLDASMDEEEKHRKVQAFTRFINQHLKKLAKLAGVDDEISTYFARHTFTTMAIRDGASMEYIQESLGHQNLQTTMNYWAGFSDNVRKEVSERLMDF